MEFSNRTVLITGAASGIGRVWAERFIREGATVLALDLNAQSLDTLAAHGAIVQAGDVSDVNTVRDWIEQAIARTGRIDVLYNNAGFGIGRRIEDFRDGDFERHIAVHLFGTIHGMRFAIPHMRRQGHGRIINTLSRMAEGGNAKHSAYAAAKAGIWSASRSAAREVADTDILVNMLIPGPTNTAIWGRDRPDLQSPEVTWPTARMLAALPAGGPSGKVFWNEKEYPMWRDTLAGGPLHELNPEKKPDRARQ